MEKAFFQNGVEGLKLAYKGSKGKLGKQQCSEIIEWLLTKDRLINCERFAPNAPQENPVEDIWLQSKKLIREFYFFCYYSCTPFSSLKLLVTLYVFSHE